MNILFFDWPCFGKNDAVEAFLNMGHKVDYFFHKDYHERKSVAFDNAFDTFLQNKKGKELCFDAVFSFNFFPLVSEGCKRNHIKYISAIYDAPHVALYSYTIVYPCNYVFIFDKMQYEDLYRQGIRTVYYYPLAGNAKKIFSMLDKTYDKERFTSDVSFVGSLYNEDHTMFDRMESLSSFHKGYLDAIMEAQLKVFGYYFIEDLLTPELIADMQKSLPYDAGHSGIQTLEYIYGDYIIGRKLTEKERFRTISSVAKEHTVKLFTRNPNVSIPNTTNMGTVDYYNEMPYVFYHSKINLNITLRGIKSGIPLRGIDIMSAGGFLMTNYQADYLDYFEPDKDFVFYEDMDDLNRKISYYLTHEEERAAIAKNGHDKILKYHTFEKHFEYIFQIVFS